MNEIGAVFTVENTMNISGISVLRELRGRKERRKITISREMVLSALLVMQDGRSLGPEGYYPSFLVNVASELVDALALIFQSSLELDKFH